MKVIKKEKGKVAKVEDLSKENIKKLKSDGYDFVNCFDNIYVFVSYKETFEDDNFNCQLRTPLGGKTFCFGDCWIVKKGIFGVKNFKNEEIEKILSLIDESKPEHWWD